MKKYKTTIILTTLITLLPILPGLLLWDKIPDRIAVHWGADGTANGWAPKAFAVFALPFIFAVIQLFTAFITLNDPKRDHIHKKPLKLVLWTVPVISFAVAAITYLDAIGSPVNINMLVSLLVGLVFIALGNYMPKLQQNYTVGIKLPWTLNSTENWTRTHRLGGRLFIVGGFLIIAGGFAGSILPDISMAIMLGIIILCVLIPCGYSFFLFRKGV